VTSLHRPPWRLGRPIKSFSLAGRKLFLRGADADRRDGVHVDETPRSNSDYDNIRPIGSSVVAEVEGKARLMRDPKFS
jgi:hypothetical protein